MLLKENALTCLSENSPYYHIVWMPAACYLYSPCSSSHFGKRLNEKIPADVSQQGFFWI